MRKRIFGLLLCLAGSYMLHAQSNENEMSFTQLQRNVNLRNPLNVTHQTVMDSYNESKYRRFKKLRNSGIALTCVGAGLITGGVILIVSGANDSDIYNNGYYDESDGAAKILGGAYCVIFGGMATGGGITMWAIGSRKMKKYGNVSLKPTKSGLGLAYSF